MTDRGKDFYKSGDFNGCIGEMECAEILIKTLDESNLKSFNLAMVAKYTGYSEVKLGSREKGEVLLDKALTLLNKVRKNIRKML